MYLGVALARLEDFDNAAAAYHKAISMDPSEALFRLNYGAHHAALSASQLQQRGRALLACKQCMHWPASGLGDLIVSTEPIMK